MERERLTQEWQRIQGNARRFIPRLIKVRKELFGAVRYDSSRSDRIEICANPRDDSISSNPRRFENAFLLENLLADESNVSRIFDALKHYIHREKHRTMGNPYHSRTKNSSFSFDSFWGKMECSFAF